MSYVCLSIICPHCFKDHGIVCFGKLEHLSELVCVECGKQVGNVKNTIDENIINFREEIENAKETIFNELKSTNLHKDIKKFLENIIQLCPKRNFKRSIVWLNSFLKEYEQMLIEESVNLHFLLKEMMGILYKAKSYVENN